MESRLWTCSAPDGRRLSASATQGVPCCIAVRAAGSAVGSALLTAVAHISEARVANCRCHNGGGGGATHLKYDNRTPDPVVFVLLPLKRLQPFADCFTVSVLLCAARFYTLPPPPPKRFEMRNCRGGSRSDSTLRFLKPICIAFHSDS